MRVSVIVPVYNAEAYLPRCLESLLSQTLADMELLLIDDGSTDGSGALLEECRARHPEKVRVLHLENGGQGRARNRGIELARGDYIGFADSDDWVEPDMYEALWTAAERAGADLAVCDAMAYPDGGEPRLLPFSGQETAFKSTAVWNKLIRRDLLGDIRFPEGKLWYEDLPVAVRLVLRAEKLVPVPRPLYCYRSGQSSTMTNRNAAKNLDMLTILDGLRPELEAAGRRDVYESLVLNHLLLDTVKRVQAMERGGERTRVLREIRRYVHREIPRLEQSASFRAESRNRRIIMRLHYMGLEDLAALVLRMKQG